MFNSNVNLNNYSYSELTLLTHGVLECFLHEIPWFIKDLVGMILRTRSILDEGYYAFESAFSTSSIRESPMNESE